MAIGLVISELIVLVIVCVYECVLDSVHLFLLKFAVSHHEILINPRISAIYWWISLINIVKSLDFLVKSLVFVLLLTVLAFFCSSETKCIVGLELWEEKLFHVSFVCLFIANYFEKSSINPLRNPYKSLDFLRISADFIKSSDF